jgi:hypothetical protein
VVVEKSEAEITAAAAKRTLNGKRLQDMQAKARAEKVSLCEKARLMEARCENGRIGGIQDPGV